MASLAFRMVTGGATSIHEPVAPSSVLRERGIAGVLPPYVDGLDALPGSSNALLLAARAEALMLLGRYVEACKDCSCALLNVPDEDLESGVKTVPACSVLTDPSEGEGEGEGGREDMPVPGKERPPVDAEKKVKVKMTRVDKDQTKKLCLLRADCLSRLGRHKRAVEDLDRAMKLSPHDPELLLLLSAEYVHLRLYTRALHRLKRAIQLGLSPDMVGTAYYRAGLCYVYTRRMRRAVQAFSLALRSHYCATHAAEYFRTIGGSASGVRLPSLDDLRGVCPQYSARTAAGWVDAESAHYLHERAKCLQALSLHEQSIDDFSVVLSIQPRNARAHFRRAFSHKAMGNTRQAASDFRSATTLAPDNLAFVVDLQAVSYVPYIEIVPPGNEDDYSGEPLPTAGDSCVEDLVAREMSLVVPTRTMLTMPTVPLCNDPVLPHNMFSFENHRFWYHIFYPVGMSASTLCILAARLNESWYSSLVNTISGLAPYCKEVSYLYRNTGSKRFLTYLRCLSVVWPCVTVCLIGVGAVPGADRWISVGDLQFNMVHIHYIGASIAFFLLGVMCYTVLGGATRGCHTLLVKLGLPVFVDEDRYSPGVQQEDDAHRAREREREIERERPQRPHALSLSLSLVNEGPRPLDPLCEGIGCKGAGTARQRPVESSPMPTPFMHPHPNTPTGSDGVWGREREQRERALMTLGHGRQARGHAWGVPLVERILKLRHRESRRESGGENGGGGVAMVVKQRGVIEGEEVTEGEREDECVVGRKRQLGMVGPSQEAERERDGWESAPETGSKTDPDPDPVLPVVHVKERVLASDTVHYLQRRLLLDRLICGVVLSGCWAYTLYTTWHILFSQMVFPLTSGPVAFRNTTWLNNTRLSWPLHEWQLLWMVVLDHIVGLYFANALNNRSVVLQGYKDQTLDTRH
ncbi:hypothetical protein KIPB_002403 [Kipferlia bialata]|uniref:Uncharacterized protein n=1 Tax=Kipferlia bialata TaxID=797122 RepID=A0A9K3CS55_9EUKA|nr:hypothetical protein KIPB_002403 [Kipferlia bialata]|eukprot:g2403.t1